jgi:hypothetical protein
MIFRCDCCLSEQILSSVSEIPVSLFDTREQLCQDCISVLVEEQIPILSYGPSFVLLPAPVSPIHTHVA